MENKARKMFFLKELTSKIKDDILTEGRKSLPDLKICMIGDLEGFLFNYEETLQVNMDSMLPAVIIVPVSTEVETVDVAKSIVNLTYNFRVQYVKWADPTEDSFDYETELISAISDAEVICSMLVNDDCLQGHAVGNEPYLTVYDESEAGPTQSKGVLEAHLLSTDTQGMMFNKLASTVLTDIINTGSTRDTKRPVTSLFVCEMDYSILMRTLYRKGGYNHV